MPGRIPESGGSVGGEVDADDVPELLVAVVRRIRHEARRDLDPLGVTPAQMRALRTVAHCGGAARMSAIADRLGIARRSVTDVVDDLASRGLVDRNDDPADRRAVVVTMTPAGKELFRAVARRRRDAAERLLGVLDEADRARLAELLGSVLDAGR